jgi:hypothetical protein
MVQQHARQAVSIDRFEASHPGFSARSAAQRSFRRTARCGSSRSDRAGQRRKVPAADTARGFEATASSSASAARLARPTATVADLVEVV